jgi:tubulin beta
LVVVSDEDGIGGDGKYSCDVDAQPGRISVFYHGASGGKYLPRAVLFVLEPSVIGAVRTSPLGELSRPGNLVNQNARAGKNWTKAHCTKAGHDFC